MVSGGDTMFEVEVKNLCPCSVKNVRLDGGGFATTVAVDPAVFRAVPGERRPADREHGSCQLPLRLGPLLPDYSQELGGRRTVLASSKVAGQLVVPLVEC